MLLRISLPYFIFINVFLFTTLISCENRQNAAHTGKDRIIESSADVIMREDAEEIFYNMDFQKYEEEDAKCQAASSPPNGYLVGEDTRVGSVIYVKCLEGFWLSGPATLACTVDNGVVKWTPDSERTCIRGQTFFNEVDTDELSDETERILQTRGNEEANFVNLPPFIHQNPQRVQSLQDFDQRRIYGAENEDKGIDRLRQEAQDQLPVFCLARPEAGPCSGMFRRYYFDKGTMECKKFYYGGCGGNSNNFESIGDCISTCRGHSILGNLGGRD